MSLELNIIPGIGLWHVHGNQDSCYVWYVSNFIEGIGWINGEIMETLWARLNLISPAAQGMSSPYRKECLDYQMNDSNFCKMIHMKRTLCWKYKLARNGISESGKAFDRLDEAAPADLKTEWLARERIAQSQTSSAEFRVSGLGTLALGNIESHISLFKCSTRVLRSG
jgi:hypothetical protein